jgi:hypothetical protein
MIASLNPSLPGNAQQQSLLRAMIACYENDDRIRALLIFGSFGQDRWDEYSDLDLEIVVRDDAAINLTNEIERVNMALATRGEQVLFTEIAGDDGYLVMASLHGIAISYHPLKSISSYVLEGWHVLFGSLDTETIRTAARANQHAEPPLSQHVHRALWLALGVDMMVQRRQFWRALLGLERLRSALAEIFAASRDGKHAYQIFEEQASTALKAKFEPTFPRYFADSPMDTIRSLGGALLALLDLIEHDLDEISNRHIQLGPGERDFIERLRTRTRRTIGALA